MGIPGQKGEAKRVVGEWTGSQAKNARWLQQKVCVREQEGRDVDRDLRIGTYSIQTPGREQSKEMSWLLGGALVGFIHLLLESGVFKKLLWVTSCKKITPGHPRLKMKHSGAFFKQVGGSELN